MFIAQRLHPCTGILLKTLESSYIYARTLEFGQDIESKILFMPRNYTITVPAPTAQDTGMSWDTTYAAIGANAFEAHYFVDGVNEQGLAGGLFYFPGFAEYQQVAPKNYKQSVPMWALLSWILTTCASTDEVKKALPKIYVSKAIFPEFKEAPPAHIVVHDAIGKSIVIEYIKGKLRIHDCPLGVITNAPNYDWHMTNLRNYINLTPVGASDKVMNGVTLSPLGQGSGMLGVPGDFTPPSRFVRAVSFAQATPPSKTPLDGIKSAFHILNNFDIPKGIAIDAQGKTDYTLWTSVIDLKNKIFYYRPYDNFQLQKVSLLNMNLDAKKPALFSMHRKEEIVELNVKKSQ